MSDGKSLEITPSFTTTPAFGDLVAGLDESPAWNWTNCWTPEMLRWRLSAPNRGPYTLHRSRDLVGISTLTHERGVPVVVVLKLLPRDGRFVATIGHYNPTTNPETLKVDQEKAAAEHPHYRGALRTHRLLLDLTLRDVSRDAGVPLASAMLSCIVVAGVLVLMMLGVAAYEEFIFRGFLVTHLRRQPVDVALARRQWDGYVAARLLDHAGATGARGCGPGA